MWLRSHCMQQYGYVEWYNQTSNYNNCWTRWNVCSEILVPRLLLFNFITSFSETQLQYEVDGTEDHDKGQPCARERVTGRLLNVLTISGNISKSILLEASPAKGRPLSLSQIKSPIPKPIGSRILESEARTIESMVNAPYLPKSINPNYRIS